MHERLAKVDLATSIGGKATGTLIETGTLVVTPNECRSCKR
jgi:hypothetical protein